MKKVSHVLAAFAIFCLSGISLSASASQDIGKISTIFVSTSGDIAITLTGGFPNATESNQCFGYKEYAGIPASADPAFKSTLLAAKAAQQTVRVIISGCQGGWFKIVGIYVE